MYIRCRSCFGKKELMGMGTIMQTCRTCQGTGFEEDCEEDIIDLNKPDEPIIKRRGRKPKLPSQSHEIALQGIK